MTEDSHPGTEDDDQYTVASPRTHPLRRGLRLPIHGADPITKTVITTLPKVYHRTEFTRMNLSAHGAARSPKASRLVTGAYWHEDMFERHKVPKWYSSDELRLFMEALALARCRQDFALSHSSAAAVLGLPLPGRIDHSVLHAMTASRKSAIQRESVAGHYSTSLFVPFNFFGIPVLGTAETIASLASSGSPLTLVTLCDAACGKWHSIKPEFSVANLTSRIEGLPRFPGKARLRQALHSARDGVGSPQETRCRLALISAGLPEPEVAPLVVAPGLRYDAHPDMVWREYMVLLEYDGPQHQEIRGQYVSDIQRYKAFRDAGWDVLVATKETPLNAVIADVRQALRVRGYRG